MNTGKLFDFLAIRWIGKFLSACWSMKCRPKYLHLIRRGNPEVINASDIGAEPKAKPVSSFSKSTGFGCEVARHQKQFRHLTQGQVAVGPKLRLVGYFDESEKLRCIEAFNPLIDFLEYPSPSFDGHRPDQFGTLMVRMSWTELSIGQRRHALGRAIPSAGLVGKVPMGAFSFTRNKTQRHPAHRTNGIRSRVLCSSERLVAPSSDVALGINFESRLRVQSEFHGGSSNGQDGVCGSHHFANGLGTPSYSFQGVTR